ncbi:hypothetical protein [Lactiplantibacillus plantarum]|nr:hypothetical protein [Lactiplantibacillus plantarum]
MNKRRWLLSLLPILAVDSACDLVRRTNNNSHFNAKSEVRAYAWGN